MSQQDSMSCGTSLSECLASISPRVDIDGFLLHVRIYHSSYPVATIGIQHLQSVSNAM